MTDQKAGRRFRVTRRKDISRLFDNPLRAGDRRMTLLAAANGLTIARLGVGVSKRHGSAVRRNRVKRLCREAFRLIRCELPAGWDYMMLPKPGAKFDVPGLQESLRALAARLPPRTTQD